MKFKDGEKTGNKCPECGKDLYYEMSFQDQFSYTTGHYTIDLPLIACNDCDYAEEYYEEEEEE